VSTGVVLGGNLIAPPGPSVMRGERSYPATIDYTCHRCRLIAASEPLPTDLGSLALYGLPKGWELVVRPLGEDDWSRCVQCQAEVDAGEPEVLAVSRGGALG
jgi:hypothetical protein